jgi:hypothetical protein
VRFGAIGAAEKSSYPVVNSSCLIGGRPGSGKSVGMSHVLRVAAERAGRATVGGRSETRRRNRCVAPARLRVATTPDECLPMLRLLETTIDRLRRYRPPVSKQWVAVAEVRRSFWRLTS